MPNLMLVLDVLLGLVLLRLYLLVPDLGPSLVMLLLPGTPEQAQAVLAFVDKHRDEEWVSRASVGAIAHELSPVGFWAIQRQEPLKALMWPVWLPACVRGRVRGALLIYSCRLRPPGDG